MAGKSSKAPAPLTPKAKEVKSVETLLPVARQIVKRKGYNMLDGLSLKPGMKVLMIVDSTNDRLVQDAFQIAVDEAGGKLEKIMLHGYPEIKEPVELVISDQFAKEWRLEKALLPGGRKMKLVQFPKAEEYPAVACASVLARAAFLYALDDLSKEIGWKLHKGAGEPTDAIARGIHKEKGEAGLRSVAKLHFKNTQKVIGRLL